MISAVLIIPVESKPAADALGEKMGWGPESYTIPLGDGETVTHYAARADVSKLFTAWVKGTKPLPDPAAGPVLGSLIADFSPDPFCDENDRPLLWGRAHLDLVLAAKGFLRM